MNRFFKYYGRLRTEDRFMYLSCDPSLAAYYRYLARKSGIGLIKQRIDSHVSVIRTEELCPGEILDQKFSGEEVEFFGNPEYIQFNDRHYWFRVISPRLEEIRLSLGFSSQPVEILDGRVHTHPFHFTFGRIANSI